MKKIPLNSVKAFVGPPAMTGCDVRVFMERWPNKIVISSDIEKNLIRKKKYKERIHYFVHGNCITYRAMNSILDYLEVEGITDNYILSNDIFIEYSDTFLKGSKKCINYLKPRFVLVNVSRHFRNHRYGWITITNTAKEFAEVVQKDFDSLLDTPYSLVDYQEYISKNKKHTFVPMLFRKN
jgi:hypothetical protein